nr:DUF1796 family putative cysteine peptidase [Acidocella sp. KAb 2-4]
MSEQKLKRFAAGLYAKLQPRRFHKVVSLGYACDVAHQIRRILHQTESYPFDWLLTPLNAVQTLIQTGFDGFLAPENLVHEHNYVLDRETGIKYLHDFKNLENFSGEIMEIREKYSRRVARWQDLMRHQASILFVRGQKDYDHLPPISLDAARRLWSVIAQAYPAISLHLLVIQPLDCTVPDFADDKITMVRMGNPDPIVWSGDDGKWQQLLSGINKPR